MTSSEKPATGARTGQSVPTFPWLPNVDWANSVPQAPLAFYAAIYREGMGAASRFMQDQASHLKNLSECESPSDVLVCQTEFAEKALAAMMEEGRRAADTISGALATK